MRVTEILECHFDQGRPSEQSKAEPNVFSVRASRAHNVAYPLPGSDYWLKMVR